MNTKRLINTFTEIVQIDSPTGEEEKMADWLLQHFAKRGLDPEKDEHTNVFITIPGDGEPIFLAAHIDTVQPGKDIVPLIDGDEIRSKGNTILGADNKSTIAVFLEVIDFLLENGTPHRSLELLFTTDEEGLSRGAAQFDYQKIQAKTGIIADIAEPIGTIVTASPWYTSFDIHLQGKAQHASRPLEAISIQPALRELLTTIELGQVDKETVINFGQIHAGTARNTIPGNVHISGEIRSFSEKKLKSYLETITEITRSIRDRYKLNGDIAHVISAPGYTCPTNDHFVQQIASFFQQNNISPRFVKSWSRSDGNTFHAKGINVLNVGDGTQHTHTSHESIRISDLEKLTRFFIDVVRTDKM